MREAKVTRTVRGAFLAPAEENPTSPELPLLAADPDADDGPPALLSMALSINAREASASVDETATDILRRVRLRIPISSRVGGEADGEAEPRDPGEPRVAWPEDEALLPWPEPEPEGEGLFWARMEASCWAERPSPAEEVG